MNTNLISNAGKVSQSVGAPKMLRPGDTALVRVLAEKGGGRYEGVVSGVRVSFSSARPLAPGSSFVATVQVNGSTIVLVPKDVGEIGIFNLDQGIKSADSNQLSALLQELGLSADSLSLSLLQISKQMEMKFDGAVLQKMRALAAKFGAKSKAAAEVAMLLAQKGIFADEDALSQLIDLLENSGQDNPQEDLRRGKMLLNQANIAEGSWFLLPFEIVRGAQTEDAQKIGGGTIRMLFARNRRLRLLNLFCGYDGADYYFCLRFDGGKCTEIACNIQKNGDDFDKFRFMSLLEEKVLACEPGAEIRWAEKEEIEGCASATEEILTFGGQA